MKHILSLSLLLILLIATAQANAQSEEEGPLPAASPVTKNKREKKPKGGQPVPPPAAPEVEDDSWLYEDAPKTEGTIITEENQSTDFDGDLDQFMKEISAMLGLPPDSSNGKSTTATNETKTHDWSSSSADFLLDFNMNTDVKPEERKAEPSAQETKTTADLSSSSSFLLDFDKNWEEQLASGVKPLKTVVIGSQTWTSENLDKSTFRNGDEIPEIKSDAAWEKAYDDEKPAWCYYKNDPANAEKYGKLYNWWAVIDSRGLAPVGYHIPSKEDWDALTSYLGSGAGKKMKAATGWNENGNGSNQSNFEAKAAGFREPNSFGALGEYAYFWTSSIATFFHFELGGGMFLKYDSDETTFDGYAAEGLSVRCVKN